MSNEEQPYEIAMQDALSKYPECTHAEWDNGMSAWFEMTIVVSLWRNTECWLAGDPPRHIIGGYPWKEPTAHE